MGEKTLMDRFAEGVALYREKAGISQEQLAERMGIVRNTVTGYETKREKNIPLHRVDDAARALGVKPIQLLFPNETSEPVKLQPTFHDAIEMLRKGLNILESMPQDCVDLLPSVRNWNLFREFLAAIASKPPTEK